MNNIHSLSGDAEQHTKFSIGRFHIRKSTEKTMLCICIFYMACLVKRICGMDDINIHVWRMWACILSILFFHTFYLFHSSKNSRSKKKDWTHSHYLLQFLLLLLLLLFSLLYFISYFHGIIKLVVYV